MIVFQYRFLDMKELKEKKKKEVEEAVRSIQVKLSVSKGQ